MSHDVRHFYIIFSKALDILSTVWYYILIGGDIMNLLNTFLLRLGIIKKPTFIEKVDKWQTEMYNYKVEQELATHR